MSELPGPPSALRRRNALWQQLRQAEPGTAVFEELLEQLSELIGWSHERLLAGLGLTAADLPGSSVLRKSEPSPECQ